MRSLPNMAQLTQHSVALMPGAVSVVTGPNWRLRTLLGSCVAVVLWDELQQRAGMCHYLLRDRPFATAQAQREREPDGRYGVEALWILGEQMGCLPGAPANLLAHIVGGAEQFGPEPHGSSPIGPANVELALAWVAAQGLRLGTVDVGGRSGRRIEFCTRRAELTVSRLDQPGPQLAPAGHTQWGCQ